MKSPTRTQTSDPAGSQPLEGNPGARSASGNGSYETAPTRGGGRWFPRFIDRIDPTSCTRCGFCGRICPAGVISSPKDEIPRIIRPDACRGCEVCERMCKDHALFCAPSVGND